MISTQEELMVRERVLDTADHYLDQILDLWEEQKRDYARGVAATGDPNYYVEPVSGFHTHENEVVVLKQAAEQAFDKATTMTDLFGNVLDPDNFDINAYTLLSRMSDPNQDELFSDDGGSTARFNTPIDMYDLFRYMNSKKEPEPVVVPDLDGRGTRVVYARVHELTKKVMLVQNFDYYYIGHFSKDKFGRINVEEDKAISIRRVVLETTMSLLFPFSYISSEIQENLQDKASGSYVMTANNLPADAKWAFYPVLHKFFKEKVITPSADGQPGDYDYYVEDLEFMVDALVKAYAHFYWYSSHLLADDGLLRYPRRAIEGMEINKSLFFDGVFDNVDAPKSKSMSQTISFSIYALLHVGLALADLIPLIRPVKAAKMITTSIRQVGKTSFLSSWLKAKEKLPKWTKNFIPLGLFAASFPVENALLKKRKAVLKPGTLSLDFQEVILGVTKEEYVAGVLNEAK